MEWCVWPLFLSQPIAPIAILYFGWKLVAIVVIALAVLWALFVQRAFVSPQLAYYGALIVRLKWITCPVSAYLLWSRGSRTDAVIALIWPIFIIVLQIPALATGRIQVGATQNALMQSLGYTPSTE